MRVSMVKRERESSTNRFMLRGLFDVLVSVARNTSQSLGLRDTSSTASSWLCVTVKMGTVICCLGEDVEFEQKSSAYQHTLWVPYQVN